MPGTRIITIILSNSVALNKGASNFLVDNADSFGPESVFAIVVT